MMLSYLNLVAAVVALALIAAPSPTPVGKGPTWPCFDSLLGSGMVLSAADSPGGGSRVCGSCALPHERLGVYITPSKNTSTAAANVNATGQANGNGTFCVALTNAPNASDTEYTVRLYSMGNGSAHDGHHHDDHDAGQGAGQSTRRRPPPSVGACALIALALPHSFPCPPRAPRRVDGAGACDCAGGRECECGEPTAENRTGGEGGPPLICRSPHLSGAWCQQAPCARLPFKRRHMHRPGR